MDAADYWRDLICATFVEVAVRPTEDRDFTGQVTQADLAGIGFARLSSHAQHVDRTRRFISRSQDHHLLANIQLDGHGLLAQGDRSALLEPGSMTFVDSARPYTMAFTGEFAQLVVRVPVSMLPRRAFTDATAIPLTATGPGRLVTDFLLGLDRTDPATARDLVPHALGLLDTALGWAASRTASDGSQPALTRERVHRFVRQHANEPDLDADQVAAGCRISRRTPFRALAEDEPFTVLLRRVRVEQAQRLLRSRPDRTVAAIAHECGFNGPAQLHRAFQRVTGITPGAYRP
ncbi:MAG TPA: helix-turn-helix domain-containing protein [Pseudonocardiaceae bacterium]|nr:helix-turn-helix domain-containing protein [Pseudonocardiaceae bacterium]